MRRANIVGIRDDRGFRREATVDRLAEPSTMRDRDRDGLLSTHWPT